MHTISSYVVIFSLDFFSKPSCIQLNEKRKRFVQFFMELKWVCNHLPDFKGQTDPLLCCISDWPQNWDDLWNLSYLQGFIEYTLLRLGHRARFSRYYKPQFVYLLLIFLKTVSLFSRTFLEKIMSLCMASIQVVCNQEKVMMAPVWHILFNWLEPPQWVSRRPQWIWIWYSLKH